MSIKKLGGYRGWKVWMSYDMHITLLALFYVLIADNLFEPLDSLILISSIGFYLMYGALINDFFDMPYDIAVGKKRPVQDLPKIVFIGLIVFIAFLSALHLLYLKNILYTAVYIFAYFFVTFYSAPPIRFKNRGLAGLVVNGLIEKMLPVLAVFTFFNHFGIDTFIFLLVSFFVQISEAMTHQIYDYNADLKTGIHSSAVEMGVEKTLKIFNKIILPFSVMLIIFLCILICVTVPYAIFIAIGVVMIYMTVSLLISRGRLIREEEVFPLYASCPYFLINNALPPFLAFILSLEYYSYIPLLLISIVSQYYMIKKWLFGLIKNKNIPRSEVMDE